MLSANAYPLGFKIAIRMSDNDFQSIKRDRHFTSDVEYIEGRLVTVADFVNNSKEMFSKLALINKNYPYSTIETLEDQGYCVEIKMSQFDFDLAISKNEFKVPFNYIDGHLTVSSETKVFVYSLVGHIALFLGNKDETEVSFKPICTRQLQSIMESNHD